MLRQFFISAHAVGIGRERKIGEGRERRVFEAQFLFERSGVEESAEEVLIGAGPCRWRGASGDALLRDARTSAASARGPADPRRDCACMILGIAESRGNHAGEAGQRHDIQHVVMEDRDQAEGVARAQVFEIVVRDQFARHVGLALEAEDLVFEIHQAAAFETQFEQAARAVEEIEMLHAANGWRARHIV